MRKYPDGGDGTLPDRPLTALQQQWRKAQTDSILHRRLWKQSEMMFQFEANGVKQWLTASFGPEYIQSMQDNIPNIDTAIGNPQHLLSAINIIMGGPYNPPTKGANQTVDEYNATLQAYNDARNKSNFGVVKPTEAQATRLITLLSELREHKQKSLAQAKIAATAALKSICAGDTPNPGLLVGLRTNLKNVGLRDWQIPPHPLDYGGANDNPAQWRDYNNILRAAFIGPLAHPKIGDYKYAKGPMLTAFQDHYDALYKTKTGTQYKTSTTHHGINWSTRQEEGPDGQASDWFAMYNHNFCIANNCVYDRMGGFGIPLDGSGPTPISECRSKGINPWEWYMSANKTDPWGNIRKWAPIYTDVLFLSAFYTFYGKAYGRTGDPLSFWETHSKYRLRARASRKTSVNTQGITQGTASTLVDLVLVNPITGAPTGKYVNIMRSSKSPAQALLQAKKFYPYLMDIDEGNNPMLSDTLNNRAADRSWAEAGKRYSSLPESHKKEMVYVCILESTLEWPDAALIDINLVVKGGTTAYQNLTWEEKDKRKMMTTFSPMMQKLYRDKYPNQGLNIPKMPATSKEVADAAIGRTHMTGFPFADVVLQRTRRSTFTQKQRPPYEIIAQSPDLQGDYSDRLTGARFDWTNMGKNGYVNRLAFGVPNKFPSARSVSNMKVFLVPKNIENAMISLHQDYAKNNDDASYKAAMLLLNSGNWLLFKGWRMPGILRSDIKNPDTDFYGLSGLASIYSKADFDGAVSLLSGYGIAFDQIQEVMSVPINDIADVQKALKGFKDSFGDIRECVVPDYEHYDNKGELSQYGGPFQMGVAFGPFLKPNNRDDVRDEYGNNFATYMWRRLPINTTGISGKKYAKTNMLNVMSKTFTQTQMSNETQRMQGFAPSAGQLGSMAAVGVVSIGGMLAYSHFKKKGTF